MAFSPVSLPLQEILLSDFIPDIGSKSNANDLLIQDLLEDLVNNLEIDLNTLAIGTDNPINYIRSTNVVIEEGGFIFQTGTPSAIIARLSKNGNNESVLNVDNLTVDLLIDAESLDVNSLVLNDTLTVNGPATYNDTIAVNSGSIQSKETVLAELTQLTATEASATITLTAGSNQNIFVTLRATTSPDTNFVYDGVGGFGTFTEFQLILDFDANVPPAPNQEFTIYIVDVVDALNNSIMSDVVTNTIEIKIKPGDNLNATPVVPIILHNGLGSGLDIGINPNSTTLNASQVLQSNIPSIYGANLSLLYIVDQDTSDRLLIKSTIGMEFF